MFKFNGAAVLSLYLFILTFELFPLSVVFFKGEKLLEGALGDLLALFIVETMLFLRTIVLLLLLFNNVRGVVDVHFYI